MSLKENQDSEKSESQSLRDDRNNSVSPSSNDPDQDAELCVEPPNPKRRVPSRATFHLRLLHCPVPYQPKSQTCVRTIAGQMQKEQPNPDQALQNPRSDPLIRTEDEPSKVQRSESCGASLYHALRHNPCNDLRAIRCISERNFPPFLNECLDEVNSIKFRVKKNGHKHVPAGKLKAQNSRCVEVYKDDDGQSLPSSFESSSSDDTEDSESSLDESFESEDSSEAEMLMNPCSSALSNPLSSESKRDKKRISRKSIKGAAALNSNRSRKDLSEYAELGVLRRGGNQGSPLQLLDYQKLDSEEVKEEQKQQEDVSMHQHEQLLMPRRCDKSYPERKSKSDVLDGVPVVDPDAPEAMILDQLEQGKRLSCPIMDVSDDAQQRLLTEEQKLIYQRMMIDHAKACFINRSSFVPRNDKDERDCQQNQLIEPEQEPILQIEEEEQIVDAPLRQVSGNVEIVSNKASVSQQGEKPQGMMNHRQDNTSSPPRNQQQEDVDSDCENQLSFRGEIEEKIVVKRHGASSPTKQGRKSLFETAGHNFANRPRKLKLKELLEREPTPLRAGLIAQIKQSLFK